MLAALAGNAQNDAPGVDLAPEQPRGMPEPALTGWLRETLHGFGSTLEVTVTRPPPPGAYVFAIPIDGRGWLAMPMPDLPPPGGVFRPLLQFLFLITGTALAVALLATYRITRPLALLEDAIARVGPGATLPQLPERGPAEVRATASALNRLSSRLKSAVDSRMRLVAAAGHDLRTPMTRMRLRAEFLPPEERERWLSDLDELDRIADSAIALVREEVAPETAAPLRIDELHARS
jgi:signal transduction histidine kinase